MKLLNEFREFAMKGNVVDMAVGVIIGAAFGKIVSSMVADVLMPPLGLLIGGVNFTGLKVTLKSATADAAAVTVNYGNFLQTLFDFLIVAAVIFSVIKMLNRLQRQVPPAPAAPSKQEILLTEIRDLLARSRA